MYIIIWFISYIIHTHTHTSIVVIPANPWRWHYWGKKTLLLLYQSSTKIHPPPKNLSTTTKSFLKQHHPPSHPPTQLPQQNNQPPFSNPKNPRKKIKSRCQWFHRQGTKGLKTWMPIHDFVTPLSKLIPRVEWRKIMKKYIVNHVHYHIIIKQIIMIMIIIMMILMNTHNLIKFNT